MPDHDCQLRALVAARDGGFEAQLIELDLVAHAESFEGLLVEIAHLLTVSYDIAVERGETPFINIPTAPPEFEAKWKHHGQKGTSRIGIIELPDHVGRVLSAFLRRQRPICEISMFEKAAA